MPQGVVFSFECSNSKTLEMVRKQLDANEFKTVFTYFVCLQSKDNDNCFNLKRNKLGDKCFAPVGAVTMPLLPDAEWPEESSGNFCLS